jgi:hypothetical protein
MDKPNLIGLSVSYCIADILAEKVSLDDVMFIVAGTRMQTYEQFIYMVSRYAKTYWRDNPGRGEVIARILWMDHRIVQHRDVEGVQNHNIASGHWAHITQEV